MNDALKKKFWDWFVNNNDRFVQLDELPKEEVERLMDEFLHQLHNYCDGLYFQIGGHEDEAERELIISAAGNTAYFSAAGELVEAAPRTDGWKFIALKPATGADFVTEHAGIRLDPRQLLFWPLENRNDPAKLGIRIFIAGYDRSRQKDYLFTCFEMLDSILGERAHALNIHHVEVAEEPMDKTKLYKITELPAFIEARRSAIASKNN